MPASRATTRRRRHAVPVLLGLSVAAWGGCSVVEHYDLLTVFFDGVPDPNAVVDDGPDRRTVGGPGGTRLAIVSAHSAYVERRCTECHPQKANDNVFLSFGIGELEQSICLKCHEPLLEEPRHLHGPVAARFCLECHVPHDSVWPPLLTAPGPELCLGCHAGSMSRPIPQHADPGRDCLDCHFGHGGNDPYFLRPVEREPEAPPDEADAPDPDDAADEADAPDPDDAADDRAG